MNDELGMMNDECRDAMRGFALIDCVESSISAFSIPHSELTMKGLNDETEL